MPELVLHFLGQLMPLFYGQLPWDGDAEFSLQSVTDPTSPNVRERVHSGDVAGRVPHLVNHLGLDSVKHTGENDFHRLPNYSEDRDRDDEANYRIGFRKAKVYADRAHQHGEARPPVGARVVAVRDERSASNLLSHPYPEERDELIAEESNDRRGGDPTKMANRLWMQQPVDCLIECDGRARKDREYYSEPGQILDATKAVGEATRRSPLGKQERNTQRDRRGGVTKIVNRVSEQGYAIRQQDDGELKCGRDEQAGEAPFDGPESPLAGRDRGIDESVSVTLSVVSGVRVMTVPRVRTMLVSVTFDVPPFVRRRH